VPRMRRLMRRKLPVGGIEGLLRRAGLLAAVAVTLAWVAIAAPAGASAAPLLWAVNSGKESVSTLEGVAGREVGLPIAVGKDPDSIAITPNGRRAWVVNDQSDSVTVIETGTRIPIATIPLPANGERVAISPDGKTAYVTVEGGSEVFEFSTESNEEVGTITTGSDTFAFAVSPSGEFAYVSVAEDVQEINLRSGAKVGLPLEVGAFSRAISYSPDGSTVYVGAGPELDVIKSGAVVKEIPLPSEARGIAVSPDGSRIYVTNKTTNNVTVIEAATNETVGAPIPVSGSPEEIAVTANGHTAYVGTGEAIIPINLTTRQPGTPIARTGQSSLYLVLAPDQPPVAAFDPPEATVGFPATFSGAPSTDPDSAIAKYQWSLDDAASPTGLTITHTFVDPGTFPTILTLTDDEGCSVTQVFTGRTAYCNGSGVASITHPVTVKQPDTGAALCSAKFTIGGVSHNRKNGTVRLRAKFPTTGSFLLFGNKIHAVTRKVRKPGTTVMTLHARVELNKQLKKTLHANVRYRITFTPNAGCGSKTLHGSVALLRAPRHKHHR
jgi:YVTN family beta-propeller protein